MTELKWTESVTPEDETLIKTAVAEIEADTIEYTHPMLCFAKLRRLWDKKFTSPPYRLAPPTWRVGLGNTFMDQLRAVPQIFRRLAVNEATAVFQATLNGVTKEPDEQMHPLNQDDTLWRYQADDFRLIYHLDDEQKRLTILCFISPQEEVDISPAEKLKKQLGLS